MVSQVQPMTTTRTTPSEYRYVLEFFSEDGVSVGHAPIDVDWEPAFEHARFTGIRRGLLPPLVTGGVTTIEPVWHPTHGEPYITAVRAIARPDGGGGPEREAVETEIPLAYFHDLAPAATSTLVERKQAVAGEHLTYRVCAYRTRRGGAKTSKTTVGSGAAVSTSDHPAPFLTEEIVKPLPVHEVPLSGFLETGIPSDGEHAEVDIPVFVPRQVLDETMALARRAGEVETGGILVGKLCRDRSIPEIFVEITAQIPARHALAERTKLTFTPETWSAAQAALDLRKQNELMLGWWHTHPAYCAKCPPENRARCPLNRSFFSSEDVNLHRTCFGHPYTVALLISDTPETGLTCALFGWRAGMVSSRGFHVTGDAVERTSTSTTTETTTEGNGNETTGEDQHAKVTTP
jgi:proteasome lid subunit RPN8/RPN11